MMPDSLIHMVSTTPKYVDKLEDISMMELGLLMVYMVLVAQM